MGKSIVRLDGYDKATGAARFAGDMLLHRMLHGKVLRSPYAHARIASIDTSKAEKLEGVVAILTHRDVPSILFGELFVEDANVLTDRARFVGDEIVAVAAETEEIAERVLGLIDIEYEELPVVLTPRRSPETRRPP